MGKTVGINDLSNAISAMVNEYSEFVSEETKKAIKKIGREAAEELYETSPRRTGDYAKSWKTKKTAETTNTIHVSVYADKEYRLTHLLENGHRIVRRGITIGSAEAIPHIKKVSDRAEEKLVKEVKKQIEK